MDKTLVRKLLAETRTTKSRQRTVEERAGSKVCLIDGCGCRSVRRGLCEHHSNQFYHLISTMESTEQRIEFEQRQIDAGNILPAGLQRKYRRTDPFSKVG